MATVQQSLDGSNVDPHKNEQQCPECRKWFTQLGQHWVSKSNHRPSLTQKQYEIIIGSLLGDGGYDISSKYFAWKGMIVRPYLEWLQDQFGVLTNSIFTGRPPSKISQGLQEHFNASTQKENCSQGFTLKTKSHPELQFCEDWGYSEDGFESRFPDNFSLTPTILKIWYVSDGNLHWANESLQKVEISTINQGYRNTYLKYLFENIGFDVNIVSDTHICILKSQTEKFFDYIGEPPTGLDCGFKYKWQYDDYDEYRRLFGVMKSQPYWDRENKCLIEDNNE